MISPEVIQKVKDAQNTLRIVQQFSPNEVKKAGANYAGRCPFHNEKSGSFIVNPAKNSYKCFGCGASGDGVEFLMSHNHLSFIDAIKEIAAMENISIDGNVPTARLKVVREKFDKVEPLTPAEIEALKVAEREKLRKAIYAIKLSPKADAIAYLKSRKITAEKLPENAFFGGNAYSYTDAEGKVIEVPSSIVFIDKTEVFINKRFIGELSEGQPKSFNKGLLNNCFYTQTLAGKESVFITEGVINALSYFEIGQSAVATYSTSNLFNELTAVSWANGKKLVFAADTDAAGLRYMAKQGYWLMKNQPKIGFTDLLFFLSPDASKDANDLLRRKGALEDAIADAGNYHRPTLDSLEEESSKCICEFKYVPSFSNRIGLGLWHKNEKTIKFTGDCEFVTQDWDGIITNNTVIYQSDNPAALLSISTHVRRWIMPGLWVNIFSDETRMFEKQEVVNAKFLVKNGCNVLLKAGADWIDDTIEYMSFVDFYTKILASAAPSTDTAARLKAVQRAAEFMAAISTDMYILEYDKVRKRFDLSKADWDKIISPYLRRNKGEEKARQIIGEEDTFVNAEAYSNANDLPDYVDRNLFIRNNFYKLRNNKGNEVMYMMKVKDDFVMSISNFTFKVIGHLYHSDPARNKRIIQLTDHSGSELLEIQSSKLRSKNDFDASVYNLSAKFFFGSKTQFERVLSVEDAKTPRWHELHVLGRQEEGFYAFEEGIWDTEANEFHPVNDDGTVEFKGFTYYSPNQSSMLRNIRGKKMDQHAGFLLYNKYPTDHKADFAKWSRLMREVFKFDNSGIFAQVFIVMSAFRSIIYKLQGQKFPLLFCLGETNSGKSQVARSIVAPFVGKMSFQNLNSDTDASFFVMLEKFSDVPLVFDEYEDAKISPTKFQAMKQTFDGIGKTKKKDASSNNLDVSDVNAALVVLGQYIPEQDDYALFNRSLSLFIPKKQYEPEETAIFNELREMEEKGVTNILIEILKRENLITSKFRKTQRKAEDTLKEELNREGKAFESRVLEVVSMFVATAKIFLEDSYLPFSFTYAEFYQIAKEKVISLSNMITKSNRSALFFKTIESLLLQDKITAGKEFKVEKRAIITNNLKKQVAVAPPRNVLFLRMNLLEPLYRNMAGRDALATNTLEQYLKGNPHFLASAINENFRWVEKTIVEEGLGFVEKWKQNQQRNTTALAFDYDALGLSLHKTVIERTIENAEAAPVLPIDESQTELF